MSPLTSRQLTAHQILLLLACTLAVTAFAAGVYGLIRGPGGTDRSTAPSPTRAVGAQPPTATGQSTAREPSLQERDLPHTSDPITYARAVAASLFDWDTSTGYLPADYAAAVLADGDPSGEETPGLLTDVSTYLPTLDQWLDLGAMNVEQSMSIGEAYVPASWASADQQSHGQLRPGTTAVTITGTRHRSGVWDGTTAESSSPVSFTVFVACAPSFPRCHVLRLSELDNPLR